MVIFRLAERGMKGSAFSVVGELVIKKKTRLSVGVAGMAASLCARAMPANHSKARDIAASLGWCPGIRFGCLGALSRLLGSCQFTILKRAIAALTWRPYVWYTTCCPLLRIAQWEVRCLFSGRTACTNEETWHAKQVNNIKPHGSR